METFKNKVFGNYTTRDYLGRGGFSAVYTAVHNFTQEIVALKIAHNKDKAVIHEFNRIVKSGLKGLLNIKHQDIIEIKEYFVSSENDEAYFIMVLPLVEGKSLDKTDLLDTLGIADRLKMFLRICNAINYAHEFEYTDQNEYHTFRIKGIFHGDIKPNNILITPDLEPKIIDFSLLNLKKAEYESENLEGDKEINTGYFGTKGYMAPEQENTGTINEKTDIFSLGIILSQFIYGPKLDKKGEKNINFKKLDQIIAKATQVNPADRYESVSSMKKEIESVCRQILPQRNWISISAAIFIASIATFVLINKFFESPTFSSNSLPPTTIPSNDLERGVKEQNSTNTDFDIQKNKYFALLIGNNDYVHWKKLHFPISDVENLRSTLIENYTFEPENIVTIKNGSYEQIYKGFESFTEHGPNTYLLVYYAGHGNFDKITDKAALIPVDAEENSDSKNITSDIIKDLLKRSKIHNILFISDACYLGAMASRGEQNDSIQNENLTDFRSFTPKKTRKFISSGARETVPDKSYFNQYMIKYLKNNTQDIIFEYNLYSDIIAPIRNNSKTTPVQGVFFDTGDEGGHFFFVRRKK